MSGAAELNRFRHAGGLPSRPAPARSEQQPYQAFSVKEPGRRYLELRQRFPLSAECPSNFGITNMEGDFRYGTGVTLEYGKDKLVIIEGRNLHKLLPALLEWKVEFIAAFDPQYHEMPKDETAPIVTRLEITTPKSERLPPMDERH